MKKLLVSLCLGLFAGSVFCQDVKPSHQKAADELMLVMNMEKTMSESIDKMLTLQMQQNPNMAQFEDVMRGFMNKYMNWSVLKTDFTRLYTEEFSERELRDMIAFYKTPTGQKMASKQTVLMGRGAELGQKAVMDHMPELQEMIRKKMEEDKKD